MLLPSYTSQAAPVLVPTVVILALIYISTHYFFGTKTADLPDLGNKASDYFSGSTRLLREGYQKVGWYLLDRRVDEMPFLSSTALTSFFSQWSAFRMQTTKGEVMM